MKVYPLLIRMTLLFVFMGFSACLLGPDFKRPDLELPQRFSSVPEKEQALLSQGEQDQILESWWTSFEDPTLKDLLQRALKKNLDVAIAESRIQEARAELVKTTSGLLPTLNVGGLANRSKASGNIFQGQGRPGSTSGGNTVGGGQVNQQLPGTSASLFRGGFDSAWELDLFGGGRRAREAARESAEAASENLHATLLSLLSEVAMNYVTLRSTQNQLAIAEENVRVQSETLSLQRTRLEVGISSELSVSQIEAQLASVRAQIPMLRVKISQTIHRIEILLGVSPQTLAPDLLVAAKLPKSPMEIPPGLPAELLRRRPDIRQAERVYAAANANIGVAKAAMYPRLTLNGSLGLQSRNTGKFLEAGSFFWSNGSVVDLPIFDGGRRMADLDIAHEQALQQRLNYEKAVIAALGEVENSLVAYEEEKKRLVELEAGVKANKRSLELAEQLYGAGIVEFLNVLNAEQSLFESQRQQALSEESCLIQLISLYKALGGGWSEAAIQREQLRMKGEADSRGAAESNEANQSGMKGDQHVVGEMDAETADSRAEAGAGYVHPDATQSNN